MNTDVCSYYYYTNITPREKLLWSLNSNIYSYITLLTINSLIEEITPFESKILKISRIRTYLLI